MDAGRRVHGAVRPHARLDDRRAGAALDPRRSRDVGRAALQWVMNGYLLVIAALVVTGGTARETCSAGARCSRSGWRVFAVGSVLVGRGLERDAMIAGRFVQGVGAAAMLPLSLSIVCDAFPPERRARALGIWAAISALGAGDRSADRRPARRRRLAADLLGQHPGAACSAPRDGSRSPTRPATRPRPIGSIGRAS